MQVLSHPEEESMEGIISMRIELGSINSSALNESNVSHFGCKKQSEGILANSLDLGTRSTDNII